MPDESPIDVPKSAVQRLLQDGLTHLRNEQKHTYLTIWYDGYCRALEHVLEMENE